VDDAQVGSGSDCLGGAEPSWGPNLPEGYAVIDLAFLSPHSLPSVSSHRMRGTFPDLSSKFIQERGGASGLISTRPGHPMWGSAGFSSSLSMGMSVPKAVGFPLVEKIWVPKSCV
jgi:hypothetical protein